MPSLYASAVLVGLLTNILLIGLVGRKLRSSIRRQRRFEDRCNEIVPFSWSMAQIEKLLPRDVQLPTWNHWSLPPDTLHYILMEVREKQPKRVVEFGAGISTICVGALLKQYGGKLFSIEHDERYAEIKRLEVARAGLADIIEIRVAEITPGAETPFGHPWYDTTSIEDLNDIELVLVDGPPQAFGREVRYPGISAMLERLSAHGQIICDDANRTGERNIKKEIQRRHEGVKITEIPMSRGCFVVNLEADNGEKGHSE